jgi:integrase
MARGQHPRNALTAVKVRSLKTPGRYSDGGGLHLFIDKAAVRRWVLRTVVKGKRRDIGLGSPDLVPLADAREQAAQFRKIARAGGDPLIQRRKDRAGVPTFSEAAESVHSEHRKSWRNEKHAAQWLTTLKTYAYPVFGDHRVDRIESSDVLRCLSPIWLTKPETARRVRQRIGTVMDWAKVAGHRTAENPTNDVERGLPRQPDRKKHHKAMPFDDVPAFVRDIRTADADESTRLALEFVVLTVGRTGEVIGGQRTEIDLGAKLWVVPGERMKGGREHRVPLVPRAIDILTRSYEIAPESEYLFAGRDGNAGLSNMTLLMAMRRMGLKDTVHGLRSTFRDWSSERTNFPNEVCEQALAHAIKDRVEAAYRRGDLLAKRRELMEGWARFVCAHPAMVRAAE